MQAAERKQLISLLDELSGAVEELLLAGLTAASKSTVERIDVTFKEASRMRLLRLGSSIRLASEEIQRFIAGSSQFSSRRLAFFLGRAWIMASGMRRAIEANDFAKFDRLMILPPTEPVEKLKVVTLGVAKKVSGSHVAFDFRLRAVEPIAGGQVGESIVWSYIYGMKQGADLPAEVALVIEQKQKFRPKIFLEKNVIEISKCAICRQSNSATRLTLSDASNVTAGEAFGQWEPFWKWDMKQAFARLEQHKPTPLDLEIELQEEVFLDTWEAGERKSSAEGFDLLPIVTDHLPFEVRLDRGPSGKPLHGVMTKLAEKKKRPPIFGVAHYESCRAIFQPLTALNEDGPEYLTISPDKVSQAALVKAMKFT